MTIKSSPTWNCTRIRIRDLINSMEESSSASSTDLPLPRNNTYLVNSETSEEFRLFNWAIKRSYIIGLDAEWRPQFLSKSREQPRVCLFQIACRVYDFDDEFLSQFEDEGSDNKKWRFKIFQNSKNVEDLVFLLDLLVLRPQSFARMLDKMLTSRDILKLGFSFKTDLLFLAGSYPGQEEELRGCFDKVEPYIDIGKFYKTLQNKELSLLTSKVKCSNCSTKGKGLSTICEEILGFRLPKDLQCSDWEQRPLTDSQLAYAAADAQCLILIFDILYKDFSNLAGKASDSAHDLSLSDKIIGLKELLIQEDDNSNLKSMNQILNCATEIIEATIKSPLLKFSGFTTFTPNYMRKNVVSIHEYIIKISTIYGEKILLAECKVKSKSNNHRKRGRHTRSRQKYADNFGEWQGPPPWDPLFGGDGIPRFLCDDMIEGLARQLRCVGIDASCPFRRKGDPREIVECAERERRILLTRGSKIARHYFSVTNFVYMVKSSSKQDQLREVIKLFDLKITEDKLLSRCVKCNGLLFDRTFTGAEAVAAAAPEQVIPKFVSESDTEFWQCSSCRQLYWEGSQYHNAIQQFSSVCLES